MMNDLPHGGNKLMAEVSKTFCILPWIHLNTWPNGKVFQCCITDWQNPIGDLTQEKMTDVWNNDYMKNLRLDMLKGNQVNSCSKCYEQEENDLSSYRISANRHFQSHIDEALADTKKDGTVDNFKLAYWDFRFSNLCNMKCRMCGGHLSSLWNHDEKLLYGTPSEPEIVVNVRNKCKDDMYQILDEQIDNLEEIYFAGGEPLIMDEHYYILEQLIKRNKKNVRIRYNTNLSKLKFKKWDNVDLWSYFDQVQVIASIDAFGPKGEYIRKGTIWPTIEENLIRMIKLHNQNQNIIFGVSCTIQLLNIKHLIDFIDYLIEKGMTQDNIHLNNVLTNPLWYHIQYLTSK